MVSPIYSYGLPVHVFEILKKLDKEKELLVLLNYGGMKAGADYLCLKYAKENGLNIKAVYTLKMPENFTLTFSVPRFYSKRILNSAEARVNKIIDAIEKKEYVLPKKCKTREEKYKKNKSNWHIIGERFSVNDNCIKCGKCIKVCLVGNISFVDGKIKFSDKCVACLGCYHRCPKKAIQYLNKKKKDRYINPFVREEDIGK